MKMDLSKMELINEASYLTAQNAKLYRVIMRVLYNEKELFNSQLSTEEIYSKLLEYPDLGEIKIEIVKSAMSQLTSWGNVTPMQDPKRVSTIEEYKNKIYKYSLTERSVKIERMTIELENLFSENNTISASLLDRIYDSLLKIERIIKSNNAKEVSEWWRNLQEDFRRLDQNFSDYIHSFASVNGQKLINSLDFVLHKDRFIEYLRDFIHVLQQNSGKIENALLRIDSTIKEDLINTIVICELDVPRTTTESANEDDIEQKIYSQWYALYHWFVSENGRESKCNIAMDYTNEIIRKIINNAVMLMQLQNSGVSRKQDYNKFMNLFADCSDINEAHCLSSHLFGAMSARHYKFNSHRSTDSMDRSKRVQEINNALDKLNADIEKYKKNIIQCSTNIEHYNDTKTELIAQLEKLIIDENKLYNIFKEELDLGFVFNDNSISEKKYAEMSLKLIPDEARRKSMAEMNDKLQNVFRQHNGASVSDYRPICKMIFADSDLNDNRSRYIIELTWCGVQVDPHTFEKELKGTIEHDKILIKEDEEDMFKNILLNTISKKLYRRIDMSRKWINEMSELMQGINTSMDLTFSLSWTPRKDIGENELKYDELNKLLSKDKSLISIEDSRRMSEHFRSKIENARLSAEEAGIEINYTELVKNVMDYRNWFEFKMHYKGKGDTKSRELTNSRFNTFSGGERAMSLYIPLFAAVAAQYKKAKDTAPMIIALDEAFAGVDESNISEMFGLLEKLGFGYIINSQALWGCYETVPALEIAELCHEKDSDMVTVILYEWNGKKKTLDDRN